MGNVVPNALRGANNLALVDDFKLPFLSNTILLHHREVGVNEIERCQESWSQISDSVIEDSNGSKITGLTYFANQFYLHLEQVDESKQIAYILGNGGSFPLQIARFVLTTKPGTTETQFKLYALGKSHYNRKISQKQLTAFVEASLLGVMSTLKVEVASDVMQCWTLLYYHVMKGMIQSYAECEQLAKSENYYREIVPDVSVVEALSVLNDKYSTRDNVKSCVTNGGMHTQPSSTNNTLKADIVESV